MLPAWPSAASEMIWRPSSNWRSPNTCMCPWRRTSGRTPSQTRSTRGEKQDGRLFDGLILKEDGTYTGIEVKTGNAYPKGTQKHFDTLVSYENPGIGYLNGKQIQVTSVYRP